MSKENLIKKDEIELIVEDGDVYVKFESLIRFLRNTEIVEPKYKHAVEQMNSLADFLDDELARVKLALEDTDEVFHGTKH